MKYPVDVESVVSSTEATDEMTKEFMRVHLTACNAAYAQGFEDGKAFTEVIANE
jgi:hypothetical protein